MSFDFTRRSLRPESPDPDSTGPVRLSPDGTTLAYAALEGDEVELRIAPAAGGRGKRIFLAEGLRPVDHAFSPDGRRLAFLLARPVRGGASTEIAWARTDAEGEEGRMPGLAHAWLPGESNLLVADVAGKSLDEVALPGRRTRLAPLRDVGDPQWPPSLAVSSDGMRIAFTSRSVRRKISEIWVLDRRSGGRPELLAEVPGASVRIYPFWSEDGASLGLFTVHLERNKTALIYLEELEGEGDVVYESPLVDLPEPPVFSPSGRHVFFFRTLRPAHPYTKTGPPALVALSLDTKQTVALSTPGELEGRLRFLDDRTLAVEGAGEVTLIRFTEAP